MTILIVEKDKDRQKMLALYLSIYRRGVDVILTNTLEAAIEAVRQKGETISCIVLNPNVSSIYRDAEVGKEFLDFLNRSGRMIPVMIFTEIESDYSFTNYLFVDQYQIKRGRDFDTHLRAFLNKNCPREIPSKYAPIFDIATRI